MVLEVTAALEAEPAPLASQDAHSLSGSQQVLLPAFSRILRAAASAHSSPPASSPPGGPASTQTPSQTCADWLIAPQWGSSRICLCWAN